MNNRDKVKTMLICLLESELANDYREKGFYGEQIDTIIQRERSKNRFQKEANELMNDLERDFFNGSINEIASELRQDNKQIRDLLAEKRRLINEVRIKFTEDFGNFTNIYKSNVLNKIHSKLDYLEVRLGTLLKLKEEINSIAKRKASLVSWMFLIFSVGALIIWIALIYFRYGWNFVEPITWISGVVLIVLSNAIYAIFGSKITPESIQKKRYEQIKIHLYGLYRFDEKECNLILEEINLKKRYLKEDVVNNFPNDNTTIQSARHRE